MSVCLASFKNVCKEGAAGGRAKDFCFVFIIKKKGETVSLPLFVEHVRRGRWAKIV